MSFEPLPQLGTEVVDPTAASPLNIMQLIQIGVLAVVALILGLFVVRPILSPSKQAALPAPTGGPANTIIDASDAARALPELSGPTNAMIADSATPENPVDRLRQMISEREDETIQILQNWVEDPSQKEQV